MKLLLLGILLALIPVANMGLRYYFTMKCGDFYLFKKHITTFYLDWLFVPMNFFVIFVLNLSFFYFLIFLVISTMIFIISMLAWVRQHRKENNRVYLFDIKTGKIKPSGFVEAGFFIIEMTLALAFFFSTIKSAFVFFEIGLGLIFIVLSIFSAFKIHKNNNLAHFDLIFFIVGIVLLLIKLFMSL